MTFNQLIKTIYSFTNGMRQKVLDNLSPDHFIHMFYKACPVLFTTILTEMNNSTPCLSEVTR